MTRAGGLAVVTGAGSGLGAAIARRLAADGYAIGAIDIHEAEARDTAQAIRAAGGRAGAYAADASNAAQLDAALTKAVAELGPLEVMMNNAGVLDGYFDVDEMDEALWRRVIEVDLTSVFLGCKRALAEMLPRGRGCIVNMASVAGLNGTGGGAAYVAAKHGVVGLTRQMAVRYAPRGIRVNCVCPGPIATNLRANSQQILGPGVPDMSGRGVTVNEDQLRALVPAGVRGTTQDVAGAVAYLVSDAAGYVNGHALVVDGGWRAK
ncbi:MAG: SDR family NAD(P)-dependent oxidoreductase [Betaproteobacteria bacterium]